MRWWFTVLVVWMIPSLVLAGGTANVSPEGVSTGATVQSSAAAACTQTCSSQTFDTDPLGGTAPAWNTAVLSVDGTCPITWDGSALQRTASNSTTCDDNNGLARFNGDISRDGCAMYQVVSSNNGAGNHDLGFEAGFVLRHQLNPPVMADRDLSTNSAIALRCETGLNCNPLVLSWIQSIDAAGLSCTAFGAIPEGGWIGACIRDIGPNTVIKMFNLGTSDPGAPANSDGGGTWGTAECTFLASAGNVCSVISTPEGCDNYGTAWGVWMRTNDVTSGAVYKIDNFRTYACQP